MAEEFGDILRQLRSDAGLGIKRLAPELQVTYSHLSKLENNQTRPSEELVHRVANYFNYDQDRLLLAAEKVPPEILRICGNSLMTLSLTFVPVLGTKVNDPAIESFKQFVESLDVLGERFINLRAQGDGHFSLVFQADDLTERTPAAVKFLSPSVLFTDSYRVQCFNREADILWRLKNQPDIVNCTSEKAALNVPMMMGNGGAFNMPVPYFSMELGTGSIDEVIEQGEWSDLRLMEAFGAMCRAVQRLHVQGITHRDLKPDNFLVMKDKTVKLADFGTARFLNDPPLESDYRGWPGDTRHTAPEMFALLHDHDPEVAKVADIFSLGTILFELFTHAKLGLHLFDRTYAAEMAFVMSQVRRDDRRRMFNQLLPSITDNHPLPSMSDFGQTVPAIIADRLDQLYRAMTTLDYRQRMRDFPSIFREIERCLFFLRRQKEYDRLQELRARRKDGRVARKTATSQRGMKS